MVPCCHDTSGSSPVLPTGTASRPLTCTRAPVSGTRVVVTIRCRSTSNRAPADAASNGGRIAGTLNSGNALATSASSRAALTRAERSIPDLADDRRTAAFAGPRPAPATPAESAAPNTRARRALSIRSADDCACAGADGSFWGGIGSDLGSRAADESAAQSSARSRPPPPRTKKNAAPDTVQTRTDPARRWCRAAARQLTRRSRLSQYGWRSSRLRILPAPDSGSGVSVISTLRGHL